MTEQEKKELAARLAAEYAAKQAEKNPTPQNVEVAQQANSNVGNVRND